MIVGERCAPIFPWHFNVSFVVLVSLFTYVSWCRGILCCKAESRSVDVGFSSPYFAAQNFLCYIRFCSVENDSSFESAGPYLLTFLYEERSGFKRLRRKKKSRNFAEIPVFFIQMEGSCVNFPAAIVELVTFVKVFLTAVKL